MNMLEVSILKKVKYIEKASDNEYENIMELFNSCFIEPDKE